MSGKVLMIDDSIPLHKLVESRLSDEGMLFNSAFDGATGIALAGVLRPSIILLDVDMPDMNGFEVCRKLKERQETSSIPILFLTAENGLKNKVKGLDLGAADYVTKPFNAEELSARIRATMRVGRQLEKSAGIDPDTGLWNRAFLSEHLKAQLSLSARTGAPLSCIEVDIDGLKTLNARHGRLFGDTVVRSVAKLLLSNCRAEDVAAVREGGRFCVVLSGRSRSDAGALAERLSKAVRAMALTCRGKPVPVTCSFGVADSAVARDTSLDTRAAAALLRAKENGGATVSVARPPRKPVKIAA
jgi:diguanylate cyclase (GGDEF)-like protein